MLSDLVITEPKTTLAHVPCPCARLGERASVYALGTCPNTKLLPVYACSLHNLCSPFGAVVSSKSIHACVECDDYILDNGRQ